MDKPIKLDALAKKHYHAHYIAYTSEKWQEITHKDPTIPRSFGQLRLLVKGLMDRQNRAALVTSAPIRRGVLRPRIEECRESSLHRLFAGLGNPFLSEKERRIIESDIDADMPVFEHSLETAHFILRWTNTSATPSDNIADPAIVNETATYLETAWTQYNTVFGVPPYLAPGTTKIEVVFWDISGYGVTTPTGPINLDAPSWVAIPGIRRPTSAHELFHRMQYAHGYRTTWTPSGSYQWFSEGSASWAEVFVWGRTSASNKLTGLFTNPDLNLWDASYQAQPFWIFFQIRQQDMPGENTLRSFLQRYQMLGNERTALAQIIDENWAPNNVYGQLDTFFALFAREREIGAWRTGPTGGAYPEILGPDGVNIVPALVETPVPLGAGDTYTVAQTVSQLGSDYYHLSFQPGTDGHDLTVSVTVPPGGDYSYYLVWRKGASWVRAEFPAGNTAGYSRAQTIQLAQADALVMIISGRGAGGSYTLNAHIA